MLDVVSKDHLKFKGLFIRTVYSVINIVPDM